MKKGLPDNCVIACSCAVTQLELISRQLCDKHITVTDLEKIQANDKQTRRLSDAAQKTEKSKEHPTLYHNVNLRLEELQEYQEQKKHLERVCQNVHHTIEGKLCTVFQ